MADVPELESLQALEGCIGYRFRDRQLLSTALTHRSAAHEGDADSYERLEFLGDSVVGLITARWLFRSQPASPEGALARWKSYLVSARVLAKLARRWRLGDHLLLGVGEEQSGGRDKRSLLADSAEAVVGAVYLDGGLEAVANLLEPWLEEVSEAQPELEDQDAKTQLQELVQSGGGDPPEYRIVGAEGPDHARTYRALCAIADRVVGHGTGASKKKAERRAAADALARLRAGELELVDGDGSTAAKMRHS